MNKLLVKEKLSSWLLTAILAVVFVLFLRENIRNTLAFLGLPGLFSATTWKAVVVLAALVFVLVYMKRIGLDLFGGCVIGFGAIVLVSTLYNEGDATILATNLLPSLSTALIVAALARDRARNLLQAMFLASVFYVICNLVYILQYPAFWGFDTAQSLLFSYRNSTFRVAIPAFICSLLLDTVDGKRFSVRSATIYVVCIVELLVGYSATALCAYVAMGIAVILARFRCVRGFINGFTVASLYILGFFAAVVFRLQEHASFFIEGVLGRTVTFTGRTYIWDTALELLHGKTLLLGQGSVYLEHGMIVDGTYFQHAHNELLNILLLGGIAGLLLVGVAVFLACKRLYETRRCMLSAECSSALLAIAIIGSAEVVFYPMTMFLISFAYYRIDFINISILDKNASRNLP